MIDRSRERALEGALFALYEAWSKLPIPPGKERPYYAERFRQTIVPACKRYKGGVRAVKDVLGKATGGVERLKSSPHLTVEHLVLSGEWDDLFSDTYRKLARIGLKQFSK
jgi:hypothetical protein